MPYPWHRILANLGRIARIYYYRWSIYNMFGPIVLVIITGLFLACVCLNVDKTEFAHVQIFLNMQSMVAFTLARNRCALLPQGACCLVWGSETELVNR